MAENGFFRGAFNQRRCLIAADRFYEWRGPDGHKTPHWISRVDEEPFAFAGLWETWGEDDDKLRTTTIITTDANESWRPSTTGCR